MKVRSPLGTSGIDFLSIRRTDKVVEIGSGQGPCFRSNVIVDKYVYNCYHRGGEIRIYPHQTFVNADGEHLPFKDEEFDYVICKHVLEHVEHPEQFVKELSRVAKRGYLETPSLLGEFLGPHESHKWVILDIDGKLVLYEKKLMSENYKSDYGRLFRNYLQYQSLFYKSLLVTEPHLLDNRYEWKDNIEIIVNPTDEKYLRYFTQPWDDEMVRYLFPPRSFKTELFRSLKAYGTLLAYEIKRLKKHPSPISIEDYLKLHHQKYSDLVTIEQ